MVSGYTGKGEDKEGGKEQSLDCYTSAIFWIVRFCNVQVQSKVLPSVKGSGGNTTKEQNSLCHSYGEKQKKSINQATVSLFLVSILFFEITVGDR